MVYIITMLRILKKTKGNFSIPPTSSPFDSSLPRSLNLSSSIVAHTTPPEGLPLAPQSSLEASLMFSKYLGIKLCLALM